MILGLPRWVNFSIIGVLILVVVSMFLFSINTDDKMNTFFKKFDTRAIISDARYRVEHAGDMARTKAIDKLLNETHDIVKGLIYITDIRLSNHTVHTDRELGDLNGNLTKLLNDNHKILLELSAFNNKSMGK